MDGSHDVGEIQLLAKSLFAGIYNWGRFLFIAILGRFLIMLSQNIIFPTLIVTDLSFGSFLYKTWDGSERVLSLFLQKGEKGQRHIITFSRRFCGESPSAAPKREGKRKATGRERGSRSPSHVIFYIKTSGRTRGQFDEHGHSMPQFLLSYPAVPCFSK